jgi:serine phosphatase RsbU (regulator of sigma subunit)
VKGFLDARLLLAPVLLLQFSAIMDPVLWMGHFVFGWSPRSRSWFYVLTPSPFVISVPNVCEALFLVGMLAIFVHRFTRTSQHEDAHRRELESARAVQQVLIPEAIPQVPGFAIESVYKPAGEVGGDFFQILPWGSGVLAVIGDVSGKGMPAAMTVSLLVGTVRTLVHYTQSPGEILAAMNQRMLGRLQGGFTTCLIAYVAADGRVTAANAGHISPYVAGREMPVENGLPLGLSAGAPYIETCFDLAANEQLTLVTDGVVEARGKNGELFGFSRTQDISREDAEHIAQAAHGFGQEDDITVLTVARVANPRAVIA